MSGAVSIPHYERLARAFADEPALGAAAYADALRAQQRAVIEDVERGTWRSRAGVEPVAAHVVEALRDARAFVDVGAHLGLYVELARATMPAGGRVVAIEPDPVRAALLRTRRPSCPGLEVVEAAAAAAPGRVLLTKPRGCSATMAAVAGETFDVAAVALDALLGDDAADVVKIDVEGAEADVVAGMPRLLARGDVTIFLECHGWIDAVRPGGAAAMHERLAAAGYRALRVRDDGLAPTTRLAGHVWLVPPARPLPRGMTATCLPPRAPGPRDVSCAADP